MSLSVPNRDEWFETNHDFPRPKWHAVDAWARSYAEKSDYHEVWCQFARHWLGRLRDTLGGQYSVEESKHFLLLSELDAASRGKVLAEYEGALVRMNRILGDTYDGESRGKFVALRFTDADDYYAYISHFFPDGEHPLSGGIFLTEGYYHMAFPEGWGGDEERRTRNHELAHNLLAHLPLPRWLNEGLAIAFEGAPDPVRGPAWALDAETIHKHRAYWNVDTIQEFWGGFSFDTIEGQQLSYNLAFVMLDMVYREIQPSPEAFRRFVRGADWHDAAAASVHEHLEVELEELVENFLGPGDWAPASDLAERIKRRRELAGEELPDLEEM
jgi:hypothetical protein